jgi:SAM-dependent methyltransferase
MSDYWDSRFQAEHRIWGEVPSRTAEYALGLFRRNKVRKILVPGSGYGRNTKLFSTSGFDVTGIEISTVAHELAKTFDPLSRFYNASVLDMSFVTDNYDAIYCYNILHLFREEERNLFVQQCIDKVRNNGLMFFTVFSEQEESYGKGEEVEKNTFESKPGRPAHYFDEDDLREQFKSTELLETGIMNEPEDHGGQPHIHILRYIYVRVQ